MNEADAQGWLLGQGVSRETLDDLEAYVDDLRRNAVHQNLIGPSTLDLIWSRHIVDAAQLAVLGDRRNGQWLDVGSGAGIPGIVLSLIYPTMRMTLCEPRRLRVDFLRSAISRLDLASRVTIAACPVARLTGETYDTITARAFASLQQTLSATVHLARSSTVWILPKGRNAQQEVEEACTTWQGDFRMVSSVTSADSSIVVVRDLQPRKS